MTDLITLRNKALLRKYSPMEKKIFDYLRRNLIPFSKEYVHKTLVNPKTNYNLYIDFYLPEHKIAIEYNGKQHYFDSDQVRLKEQRFRDRVKEGWCKANGIHLIIIPYDKQSNYKQILDKEILKLLKNKDDGRSKRVQTTEEIRSINKRAIRQKEMERRKARLYNKRKRKASL